MNDKIDKKCIMIVDDNKDFVEALKMIIEFNYEHKCEIITGFDGCECLKILEDKIPKLIILGYIMPGMSGVEATKIIRSNEETKNIPIIGMSGGIAKEEIVEWIKTIDVFLQKPIQFDTLFQNINQLL